MEHRITIKLPGIGLRHNVRLYVTLQTGVFEARE